MTYEVYRHFVTEGKESSEVIRDVSRIAIKIPYTHSEYDPTDKQSYKSIVVNTLCNPFTWHILRNKVAALGELGLSNDVHLIMFEYNTRCDAGLVIHQVKTELEAILARRLSSVYMHPLYIYKMFTNIGEADYHRVEHLISHLAPALSQDEVEHSRNSIHVDDLIAALDEVTNPHWVDEVARWELSPEGKREYITVPDDWTAERFVLADPEHYLTPPVF